MVNIATIETFDHEVAWEAEVFAHFDCFFVNNLRSKVFCNAAIVYIAELIFVILMVEQVVHVDIIDIALNACKVNSILLLFIVFSTSASMSVLTSYRILSALLRLLLFLFVTNLLLVLLFCLSTFFNYCFVVLIRLILFGRFVL